MPENTIAVDLRGKLWINRVTAPADWIVFDGYLLGQEDLELAGGVVNYGPGRSRAVFTEATAGKYQAQLKFVERVKYEELLTWRRQTLMLRDNKRRKFYGTFLSVSMEDYGWWAPDERRDVSFDFLQVSFSEAV